MEKYSSSNIETAVTEFYKGHVAGTQQWLKEAQMSPDAWTFIWELLQPTKAMDLQFFAATTLHTKIKKHWHEVAVEDRKTLKNRILDAIKQNHNVSKSVLNKLCFSMAAYMSQLLPTQWPHAMHELISIFKGSCNNKSECSHCIKILLEILTLFPEEAMNIQVEHDQDFKNALKTSIKPVLDMIIYYLGHASYTQLHEQASICAHSWLRLQLPISNYFQLAQKLVTAIISSKTASLYSESTRKAAINCLVCLVTLNQIQETPVCIEECLKEMLKLQKIIPPVNAPLYKTVHYQILELFVVVGEYHSENILLMLLKEGDSKEVAKRVINLLKKATEIPGRDSHDESLSMHAFSFWNNFWDDLKALDMSEKVKAVNLIFPVYTYLVDVLLNKLTIAVDFEKWPTEDKENFNSYRKKISESYCYCYQILNERMLDILVRNMNQGKCEKKWQNIESVINAWSAIALLLPGNTQKLVPLFNFFKKLPLYKLHKILQMTVIACIGKLGELMNNNPTYMQCGISALLSGLKSPTVAQYSCRIIYEISKKFPLTIQPFVDEIIPILENTIAIPGLNRSLKNLLINTMGNLLSLVPFDKIMLFLNKFIGPFEKQLQDKSITEMITEWNMQLDVCVFLEILCTLFFTHVRQAAQTDEETRASNPKENIVESHNSLLLLLKNILPFLNKVIVIWGENEVITKLICTLFKYSIESLGNSFDDVLDDVILLLFSYFQKFKQSAILDFSAWIAVYLQHRKNCLARINVFINNLCDETIRFCLESKQPSENYNLIESFFILLTHLLNSVPDTIMNNTDDSVKLLLLKAIEVCELPEKEPVTASLNFFKYFVKKSQENKRMSELLNQVLEQLVNKIMQCIGESYPEVVIIHMADLLYLLNEKPSPTLKNLMHNAILLVKNKVPLNVRMQFISNIVKEKSSRRIHQLVEHFAHISKSNISLVDWD